MDDRNGHRASDEMAGRAPGLSASGPSVPGPSAVVTGARGRCPRCGEGHIFRGFLTMRERCERCGLDYSFADPADGPAVFVQLFACVPGVIFILMLEIMARPGLWVHLAVGAPVLILTTILPLRPIKGWLVAAQYVHRAQEAGTADLWNRLHGGADRPES